ncbi:MAG: DUF5615 family PIN-like protein [Pirellulales bacterium]
MTAIRFFTDEDVYGVIAVALRRAGFDAVSTPEVGRLSRSDESQFIWATEQQRVLVTFNVSHFAGMHSVWLRLGKSHAGVVVSVQRPIGELLRRLLHLSNDLHADAMLNRLEFLSDW